MPLKQSPSKKAMSANIKTEMAHGKPQAQSVAIAYDIARRNKAKKSKDKVKMAEGGYLTSAKTEKRPMPSDLANDSTMARQQQDKPMQADSQWTDQPTVAQARKNKYTPLSESSIVKGTGPFSVRSRRLDDEEREMQLRMKPQTLTHTSAIDHEEDEKTMGKGPDMSPEHSTHKKPYAKGGEVESSDYDHAPNRYMDDLTDLPPSHDEGEEMANSENEEGPDRQGPRVSDMERQHNSGRKPYAMGGYAEGGHIQFDEAEDSDSYESEHENTATKRRVYPGEMSEQPEEEHEEEEHNSLADAIMAKRRSKATSMSGDPDYPVKMARGGAILSEHSMETTRDSQTDLRRNTQEDANMEDKASFDALRKENYSDDYMNHSQPTDSNEHSDDIDADVHDMISKIRAKMRAGRQY